MSGRRGRSLSAVATGLLDCGPSAVYVWLLRTHRMACPDPAVNTQNRFGQLLGHDGTFVSHVEAGRRPLPADLRERWFTLIGLDGVSLQGYLTYFGSHLQPTSQPASRDLVADVAGFEVLDQVLESEPIPSHRWPEVCAAAASLPMPRTLARICRRAADVLALGGGAEYRYADIERGLLMLPHTAVAEAVLASISQYPGRGYHGVQLLGELDGVVAGPMLRTLFDDMPDPWLERGLAESMRRLVARGDVTTVADEPVQLQHTLFDGLPDASSWTARIEVANLVAELGPLPASLQRRLAAHADADVRLTAGAPAEAEARTVIATLREQAIAATLDAMYGSPVSDPLADRLAGDLITGRTRRARIHAAHALALSPYATAVAATLSSLTTASGVETRRAVIQALQYLPAGEDITTQLIHHARHDPDPDVRGRATCSLLPHHTAVSREIQAELLRDTDPKARRGAIDLVAASGNIDLLRDMPSDPDFAVARHVQFILAT